MLLKENGDTECLPLSLCVRFRDLIKVLKWYVDRIIDAEHQDHIQQVLKVRRLWSHFLFSSRVCAHTRLSLHTDTPSPPFTHINYYPIHAEIQTNSSLSPPPLLIHVPVCSRCIRPLFLLYSVCCAACKFNQQKHSVSGAGNPHLFIMLMHADAFCGRIQCTPVMQEYTPAAFAGFPYATVLK